MSQIPEIIEKRRLTSPCVTPQGLAFAGKELWLSSRETGRLYRVEIGSWKVLEDFAAPGVIWSAVSVGDELRCTIGLGEKDDRYIYSYSAAGGFQQLFACPDFTGSYLSFDGTHLYLSQWYKGLILRLDESGQIVKTIEVGAEICGHTFADGLLYVLRGQENGGVNEEWSIARIDLSGESPQVHDLATVPFAARSLAFDGENFWSNHRAANETVVFAVPE